MIATRIAILLAGAAAAGLSGCNGRQSAAERSNTAVPAQANAARQLDKARTNSWITIGGKVVSTGAESFLLDYGYGRVTVAMKNWDWYHAGKLLKPGDSVSVTGLVDQGLFGRRMVDATSVFVKNLDTRFFANDVNAAETIQFVSEPSASAFAGASGYVTAIKGREMTIGTGAAAIQVSTAAMPDNPLDDVGLVKVKVGDRVQAWGRLTLAPNGASEILASGLTVFASDKAKQSATAPQKRAGDADNVS